MNKSSQRFKTKKKYIIWTKANKSIDAIKFNSHKNLVGGSKRNSKGNNYSLHKWLVYYVLL